MPEKLKNLFFSESFLDNLGREIQIIFPEFKRNKFNELIHIPAWDKMELKQRMRHISECLHQTLPLYPQALKILEKVAPNFRGFDAMIFPDFVEQYGLDYRDISLRALWHFTKLCSSEFAIRVFLMHDLHKTIEQLHIWAEDADPMVRRLASEGCRPRLPWAMALPALKRDPRPIIPILEKLKDDESGSVRRSVANNLNDISKDHPGMVMQICRQWYGKSENLDKLIKHACRDMLKSGYKDALILFGFDNPRHVLIQNLKVGRETISIGDDVSFSFEVHVKEQNTIKLRLEYIIHFVKANGKHSPKIFQVKEGLFNPGLHRVQRRHSFRDFSTRKHYPGLHFIAVIVNGEEKARTKLEIQ